MQLTPEQASEIRRRVPFHLQTRRPRHRVFCTGGKTLPEASLEEIEALRKYDEQKLHGRPT